MIKRKSRKTRKHKELPLPEWAKDIVDNATAWCQGRMWWPRLLLLLFFLHITVLHLKDPMYSDIFKGLNLGFHEMGHVIFSPLGQFMAIAGGSLFQCMVPLLSTLMFARQRDYFGIAFCFGWLSTNLFDVALYAGDARAQELPLVSPFGGGEEIIHDWNYLLESTHLIRYDYVFANTLRFSAVASTLVCTLMGAWLIYHMMQSPKKRTESVPESWYFAARATHGGARTSRSELASSSTA